jgi:predicted RNase H-like HicB family nuclease
MKRLVALVREAPDGGYHVAFPNFPTLRVVGETLNQARSQAKVALFLQVRGLVAEGEAIPDPSSLEAIMADPRH